jgi:hypothetical protein
LRIDDGHLAVLQASTLLLGKSTNPGNQTTESSKHEA